MDWTAPIAALRAVGVSAAVENVGGGNYCLTVPLDETGRRFAWLGTGTDLDADGPLWVDDRGPLDRIGGVAYLADEWGDVRAMTDLEEIRTDPTDLHRWALDARVVVTALHNQTPTIPC